MRGIAALSVALFHWEHIAFATPNPDQLFRYGLLGVEFFFMVSGFVIMMVVARRPEAGEFWLARMVRLYPAYWVSVLVTALYVLAVGKYDLAAVLVNATMLQSFLGVPNITNPYWTLAFELSFYLGMTIVVRLGATARIEAIALGWLAAGLIYRIVAPGAMAFDAERPWVQLAYIVVAPQFSPFFVAGMMLYRWREREMGSAGRFALLLALATTFLGRGDFAQVSGPVYGLFALAMATALFLASGLSRAGTALRVFAWLGLVSYPLYLLHCSLANLAGLAAPALALPAWAAVLLSAPVSLLLAWLVHARIERPAQRWGRRLLSRPGDIPAPVRI
ncbi:Peptidoglycan/LPS O-acetylase OafA/YrhL, contains acyltransferase and SGNH-hydrolase domains [Bosea sp. CRIB-10]|uniref:acyltransferase family protein n=1 Tax=Bosea sp. CRIB-10 TaxID=378404 RepID=UPI0008E0FD34|nr:Peptidoglycan/LPS O-acetylase OafA/YrhL, contains acyltransferase and SGNH-hydrolase domains [Bosea sp. CRIB-10]